MSARKHNGGKIGVPVAKKVVDDLKAERLCRIVGPGDVDNLLELRRRVIAQEPAVDRQRKNGQKHAKKTERVFRDLVQLFRTRTS